jgi:6-phosphofructokinase 1
MTDRDPTECDHLGEARYDSPFVHREDAAAFVDDRARVLVDVDLLAGEAPSSASFERAGPRKKLFFDAERTRAAIVTCGGLCPGMNTAIRSIFLELHHLYRVREVLGFRYGFEGMTPKGEPPWVLTHESVRDVHRFGGTVLGTSRGKQDPEVMIETLLARDVSVLLGIGGEGTLRGLSHLAAAIGRRGLPIAVVGVPKTIDDDIPYVDKTFGFDTAVERARAAIDAAHAEALGSKNGIGLVKLMGRDAGFVAAAATMASGEANFCLLPEVPWSLPKLLEALAERVKTRGHAVVVVAEGCGAALAHDRAERDASGNFRYASDELDIGPRLRDAINLHFGGLGVPISLKYIDPSYMIRSSAPNSADDLYAGELARHAVHAAMAGRTNILLGRVHGRYVHVPLPLATATKRRVAPELARLVHEVTGQPSLA